MEWCGSLEGPDIESLSITEFGESRKDQFWTILILEGCCDPESTNFKPLLILDAGIVLK